MIPITKNIIVVDEQGNEYGATYLKRAKGLVKKGRARFLSESMICLACPPDENLEDIDMSEQTIDTVNASENTQDKYSMEYCLSQIERISLQTEYLNQVIAELRQMKTEGLSDDSCSKEKMIALADVVKCRETTNQQLLRFYEKMYEDLRRDDGKASGQRPSLKEQGMAKTMDMLEKALADGSYEADDLSELFGNILDGIRYIEN